MGFRNVAIRHGERREHSEEGRPAGRSGDRKEPSAPKDGLLDRLKDWLDELFPAPTPDPVPVPVGPDRRRPPRR
jgi:hypothetical protein